MMAKKSPEVARQIKLLQNSAPSQASAQITATPMERGSLPPHLYTLPGSSRKGFHGISLLATGSIVPVYIAIGLAMFFILVTGLAASEIAALSMGVPRFGEASQK